MGKIVKPFFFLVLLVVFAFLFFFLKERSKWGVEHKELSSNCSKFEVAELGPRSLEKIPENHVSKLSGGNHDLKDIDSLLAILEEFGPGKSRLEKIKDYFFSRNASLELLLEEAETLLSDEELLVAITGLQSKIALCSSSELGQILDLLNRDDLTENQSSVLMYGLSLRFNPTLAAATMGVISPIGFGEGVTEREFKDVTFYFERLFRLLPEEKRQEATEALFQGASAGNSHFAIDYLLENENYGKIVSKNVKRNLVREFLQDNPKEALLTFFDRDFQRGEDEIEMLSIAFEQLFQIDEKVGENYLEKISHISDGIIFDSYKKGKARTLSDRGKFSEANSAIATIANAKMREESRRNLWQKQTDEVKIRIQQNPEGAITEFISGNTPFEQKFLETAVSEWITIDNEAAADWIEQQGSTINPETMQYIAAACAVEAINQGDILLAKEWSSLVQNDEIIARITNTLAETEGSLVE